MKKFWEEVAYFDLTEIYTHDPIADWHRIFNLWSFLGKSSCWIYLDWIDLDYFSDLYRSRRCTMKKRIEKKYELLERIDLLERAFIDFAKDTFEIVEVLTNKIKQLEKNR